MRKVDITIPTGAPGHYQVVLGEELLGNVSEVVDLDRYSRCVVLTDEVVGPLWANELAEQIGAPVITIPSGEEHKTVASLQFVADQLLSLGADRNTLLFNVGGGVIGDLGGCAASVFMRGMPFVQVPTTLLSMVDASVGGKTGVNLDGLKNGFGVFAQPKAVLIDVATLETLPERLLTAGMAEMIKHGCIADRQYASSCVTSWNSEAGVDWLTLIEQSVQIKAEVVMTDERERGLRRILNFGHTIGHALETDALNREDSLLHGEAVALGMVAETAIAEELEIAESGSTAIVRSLLDAVGLPTTHSTPTSTESLLELVHRDKKQVSGVVQWTLLSSVGVGVIDQQVSDAVAAKGLDAVLSRS